MIRCGRCTRVRVAGLSSVPAACSLCLHTSSLLQSSPSSVLRLSPSLGHAHANTEGIISGGLGVKVRYDKRAAVVVSFE